MDDKNSHWKWVCTTTQGECNLAQLLLQTKGYLAGDCFIAEINVLFSPLDTAKQKQKNWLSSDTDEIYTAEITCYLNKAKNEHCDKLGKIHVFLQKPFTFHFSNR